MATHQVSKTDLINSTMIPFIRSLNIAWSITDCKPNCALSPYFDDKPVSQWITPSGKNIGESVITDSVGAASGTFSVPAFTFNSGIRLLRFIDNEDIELLEFNSNASWAEAEFESRGMEDTYQTTVTTTTEVTRTPPPTPPGTPGVPRPPSITPPSITSPSTGVAPIPIWRSPYPAARQKRRLTAAGIQGKGKKSGLGDPLAQSFFTHGVTGGVSITKIDIFFATKDVALPVICEIRELVNGYPGPILVSEYARAHLRPEQVTISTDASIASSFIFPAPVILEENQDYCFVLLANSNRYHVWTSRVGEPSKETGKVVFEQPFIGSLFKSENNITWTADQFEDIKFVLWKAAFDTSGTTALTFDVFASEILLTGDNCSVISGSSIITMKFEHIHALRSGDYLSLTAQIGASYRGIPASALTGDFAVTVVDDYTIMFNCNANATSSGTLEVPGIVNAIIVDAQGNNYSDSNTITISDAPSGGVTAQATPIIESGKIVSVNITNPGSGYIVSPTMTLNTSTGSGAELVLISESFFVLETNRAYDTCSLSIDVILPPYTSLASSLTVTDTEYKRKTIDPIEVNEMIELETTEILVSHKNQSVFLPNQPSTNAVVRLLSTNRNCSPFFHLGETPTFGGNGYIINNQTVYEDILSTNSSGSLTGLTITEEGSGYTTATVTVSVPDILNGVRATATATVVAGKIDAVTITNAGLGYLKPPSVSIGGTGSITVIAGVQAVLNTFNSELLPLDGTAYSKYLTKQFSLETVSNGIRLYMNAYSELESNIDVYFRTTLSSSSLVHSEQNWTRLLCDTERNRSMTSDEFLDYTFYRDDLPDFDTYDLKIILRSSNRHKIPMIKNYRAIILS